MASGEGDYSNDEEMFDRIHQMRVRIITAPSFSGGKVIGAILFERTMDGEADGLPVPAALWKRGVVPFLKVDKGLEDEANGVQLMKPMPGLDALARPRRVARRVRHQDALGDQPRQREGIAAIVRQQFEVAEQICGHGLMPIVEPEVSIKSPERAEADRILLEEIAEGARRADRRRRVMLKLSIPAEAGPVRAAGRPSPRRARGRLVGRLFAPRRVPPSSPATTA